MSEDARKQAIIAPILLEVCEITQTQFKSGCEDSAITNPAKLGW
jgi:hypothetical protein